MTAHGSHGGHGPLIPGDPIPPLDDQREHTLVETLPDGSQRAWISLSLAGTVDRDTERNAWIAWLLTHGFEPSHVVVGPCITRDPATRTVSAGLFGPPENPGQRIIDQHQGEPGYVKHRSTRQLEAEPQPFPTATP